MWVGWGFTLGGYGVFGARGGVGLAAVAAGVLQRVPAALLLLHTQTSGQNHGKSAGCWGERLTMLRRTHIYGKCMSITTHLHNLYMFIYTLGKTVPCLKLFLGQFSLGGDRLVASQNTPTDWVEFPALSSYPQTPSYAAECWPRMAHRNSIWPSPGAAEGRTETSNCAWPVFAIQQSCSH